MNMVEAVVSTVVICITCLAIYMRIREQEILSGMQWREGLLSKEEAIQAAMRYDGFETVELLHDDEHVERIELPPTALDQFYQLNDAVVSLTEAIQAGFPSVRDIPVLFASVADVDRSAWVEDVTAAPKHWTLGDDGEIISDEQQ